MQPQANPIESQTQTQGGSGRPRPGVPELDIAEGIEDRDLQDEVIRYLTDAKLRSIGTKSTLLNGSEAERAIRFSKFLARRYYRDRLHRGFRYSSALVSPKQAAELVVECPEFDSILETSTLGSLETSREVGQLAVARLMPLRQEAWWSELLDYELAFFVQLATSEPALPSAAPRRNPSAILRRFQFRIPQLLVRLKAGENIAGELRGETTLLFSRTHQGKIYVVETDEGSSRIFLAADGNRSTEQIASSSAISDEEARQILSTLSDIGAVMLPTA